MKTRLVFLSILFIGQTICYSQSYKSILGNSSTAWAIARQIPDAIVTESLYTTVDSTFGGYLYKSINADSFNHGFLREDTTSGKVWFYSNLDMAEYLIMDLSLSVGDSFLLNMATWLSDSLALVDSVYYIAGNKHVQLDYMLQVYDGQEKLTFIEGLGSNAGFLYQNEAGGDWNMVFNNYLLCSFKDDTSFYTNTLFNGDCDISLISVKETTKSISWKIYPNPFDNYATLTFDNFENENYMLTLFDMHGRIVRTIQDITTGKVIIKRENLNGGLYFFQVRGNRNIIVSGKMSIE